MDLRIGILPTSYDRTAARAWLEPALAYGSGEGWDDVAAELDREHAQLWEVRKGGDPCLAAAVTRLCEDGAAEFWLCGGADMAEWLDPLIDKVSRWARDEGKTRLRLIGRPGWKRTLPDWKERGVILERAL